MCWVSFPFPHPFVKGEGLKFACGETNLSAPAGYFLKQVWVAPIFFILFSFLQASIAGALLEINERVAWRDRPPRSEATSWVSSSVRSEYDFSKRKRTGEGKEKGKRQLQKP